jgi:hypothetical protein
MLRMALANHSHNADASGLDEITETEHNAGPEVVVKLCNAFIDRYWRVYRPYCFYFLRSHLSRL